MAVNRSETRCSSRGELHIQQVEPLAELDDRTEHGRFLDVGASAFRLLHRPFHRSCGAMFPKVNAGAEPIVGVEAGGALLFACEHGIPQAAITAVEGEDGALVVQEVHEARYAPRLTGWAEIAKRGF